MLAKHPLEANLGRVVGSWLVASASLCLQEVERRVMLCVKLRAVPGTVLVGTHTLLSF